QVDVPAKDREPRTHRASGRAHDRGTGSSGSGKGERTRRLVEPDAGCFGGSGETPRVLDRMQVPGIRVVERPDVSLGGSERAGLLVRQVSHAVVAVLRV